jgi:hypothetical protein
MAFALAAALASPGLAMPAPTLMVPMCGGGSHPLGIPGRSDRPDPGQYCQTACHACLERKPRRGGTAAY